MEQTTGNFIPQDSHVDKQYLKLLKTIMETGVDKSDRTGTGARSIFGYQMRFPLSEGFPLLTTKKVHTKSIFHELIWFIKGSTNIGYLKENGVSIWDEWADANGELGPVYGKQWRAWETSDGHTIDQLKEVIEKIKTRPNDRRLIVSSWNVGEVDKMKLPPCHMFYQFYVANGKLSCQMYQRSCDTFLGLPFNIASYALFTMMIAQVTNLEPGDFIWDSGDTHIYSNHFEQVKEQLSRENDIRPMPKMVINPEVKTIDDFVFEDFKLENYTPLPHIKGAIAV